MSKRTQAKKLSLQLRRAERKLLLSYTLTSSAERQKQVAKATKDIFFYQHLLSMCMPSKYAR